MIKQNRFSRYLIYAIGEIILVVIGILIAVQINDHHSNKNNNNYEREVVGLLIEDLTIDQENFEIYENKLSDGLKVVNTLLKFCNEQNSDSLQTIAPEDFIDYLTSGFTGQSQFLISQQLHRFNPRAREVNRSITLFTKKHAELSIDIEKLNRYSLGEFLVKTTLDLDEVDELSLDFLLGFCNENAKVNVFSLKVWQRETLIDIRDLLAIETRLRQQLNDYLTNLK